LRDWSYDILFTNSVSATQIGWFEAFGRAILSDAELAAHGAIRRIADGPRPCRISLSDAKAGDELILVN
jgi:hypothetical protein